MPKTCRTDTFMSGKPAGSWTLVMAAVVINPPGSRALPKPDCGVAADGCWAEPIRERPLEEACAPIKVPLSYHQDRHWARFLEGCPANHAILFHLTQNAANSTRLPTNIVMPGLVP